MSVASYERWGVDALYVQDTPLIIFVILSIAKDLKVYKTLDISACREILHCVQNDTRK